MNVYVINLKRRPDRFEFIRQQLSDIDFEVVEAVDGAELNLSGSHYKYYKKWVDPLLDRRLTLGEIATTLSHIKAWNKVANCTEPALILEDDSHLTGQFDIGEILYKMESCDMLYLNHREMFEAKEIEIDDKFVKPYYPYLGNAYVLTPEMARTLIAKDLHQSIIPVDEFFPIINGVDFNHYCLSDNSDIRNNFLELSRKFNKETYRIYAYKTPVFSQVSRSVMGSDIEKSPSVPNDHYFLTVGTDEDKMEALHASCSKHGVKVVNIGAKIQWDGGDMASGPGGGHKLNLVKKFLNSNNLPDDTIIGFFDGYDVIVNSSEETLISRFKAFKSDIVFAAEKNCWPDKNLADKYPLASTEYRYLNSGCYMGYASAIKNILKDPIKDQDDDQLYLHHKYIEASTDYTIKLDHTNELFQCLSAAEDHLGFDPGGNLFNLETKTSPCVLHGNGGPLQKEIFRRIYTDKFLPDLIKFVDTSQFEIVAPEILLTDFFTKRDCDNIIYKAEIVDKWESLPGDKFPGQEVRIKALDMGLYDKIVKQIEDRLISPIEKYWFPLQMYGIRDMFIIKYKEGSQISLPCHHDASLVTITIRLNDEYEGAELYFRRQEYSNKDVKTGQAIIWPGQVTHGHESRPLKSGIKYSLVIWTSRYKDDVN